MDRETGILIKSEHYDADGNLSESLTTTSITVNAPVTDETFFGAGLRILNEFDRHTAQRAAWFVRHLDGIEELSRAAFRKGKALLSLEYQDCNTAFRLPGYGM